MIYDGGHVLRPYFGILENDGTATMICRNCLTVDPEPGGECSDDPGQLS